MFRRNLLLLLIFPCAALGQQQTPASGQTSGAPGIPAQKETIVVTGTFLPAPLSENDRSVRLIETTEAPLLFNSVMDYLQTDPNIDLQQRAPNGVQADLSILGSTFAETLVLLNGLRMNDAQTAHHDMDIPIPLEAISRIEVLHGAGSTLYGSDAMGGAVNFITAPPPRTEFRMRLGLGNFGFNQERVTGSFLGDGWSEQISASRDFSTGFRPD